jgi:hypothetical protein
LREVKALRCGFETEGNFERHVKRVFRLIDATL